MKTRSLLLATFFAFIGTLAFSQNKIFNLYEGKPPGTENWDWQEGYSASNVFQTPLAYNVTQPTLTLFAPKAGKANGAAMIICPGGGFQVLSIESEGYEVARALVKKGITCFVLKYRVLRSMSADPAKEWMENMAKPDGQQKMQATIPLSIADGKAAIGWVRSHAADFGIDPNKVGILGFSAGGTISTMAGMAYTAETKPNVVGTLYPFWNATLTKPLSDDAPPLFIAAASDDNFGFQQQSIDLYQHWLAAKKTTELHLYHKGGHGFGMRRQNLPSDGWISRFTDWLSTQGFVSK
jgi:acetyl esterase/lipase